MYVAQEVEGDDTNVLQSVVSANRAVADVQARIRVALDANDDDNLTRLYAQLESLDASRDESRAASILSGLGFTLAMQKSTTRTLSGGWRMRLALARALFMRPDLYVALALLVRRTTLI